MLNIEQIVGKIEKSEITSEEGFDLYSEYRKKKAGKIEVDFIIDKEVFKYDELYLKDHIVLGEQVLLGVTHCSLAIEAAQRIFPGSNKIKGIHRLLFSEAIILKHNEEVSVVIKSEEKDNRSFFRSMYKKSGETVEREAASGEYIFSSYQKQKDDDVDIKSFQNEAKTKRVKSDIYQSHKDRPIIHGPSLQTVQNLFLDDKESLAELQLSKELIDDDHHYSIIHPGLLDGAFVTFFSLLPKVVKELFVPIMIKDVYIFDSVPPDCFCSAKLTTVNEEMIEADCLLLNKNGEVLVSIKGLTCKRIRSKDGLAKKSNNQNKNSRNSQTIITGSISPREFNNSDDLKENIQTYLSKLISSYIGKDVVVETQKNFMDLGVESNQAISMVQDMEKLLGIELYPTLLFEYQNIEALTDYFAKEYGYIMQNKFQIPEQNLPKQEGVIETSYVQPIKEKGAPRRSSFSFMQHSQIKGVNKKKSNQKEDIAIIGMSGVFSQSETVDQFWQHLYNQTDLITEIPADHFDYKPWFDTNKDADDQLYCKWGSFISDVDKFDSSFFSVSPKEAELMDPQLRHLLQVLYATSEDAGYIQKIRGSNTGIYVGVSCHDYNEEMIRLGKKIEPHDGTGNAATMLANRPSFYFNLTGPSLAIDTACSSSLVALHLASEALRNEECDNAFVAGVNLLLTSGHYRYFSSLGALSSTGRCYTFDHRADGYVPGETVASVLLKPLSSAINDRDNIYGIIKGSAIRHGGYTPSITAPSVDGEVNVLVAAWENAGITPDTLSYIEAHGTGTKLGDPVEINALKKAFKKYTDLDSFCAIGSAKAHIGHAEGAAGIAGVIKVLLSMKHKTIPAMPKFEKINPYIKLAGSPFYINNQPQYWDNPDKNKIFSRRAGVNSFGFGGAYAHVVLEEYKQEEKTCQSDSIIINKTNSAIIVLSAKNEERLKVYAENLMVYLKACEENREKRTTELSINDIAYTLQVGREAMEERLVFFVKDINDLILKLEEFINDKRKIENCYQGQVKNSKDIVGSFTMDDDLKEAVDKWIAKGKVKKLAELWSKGLDLNWDLLYRDEKPKRISLPTYPFAKERYWIDLTSGNRQQGTGMESKLHPLVHINTSDLETQQFSSTFTGQEFFLKDHKVKNKKILPGVAYIEMARAAGEFASKEKIIKIKNIVWAKPILVNQTNREVKISLYPENGHIAFEVFTTNEEIDVVIHSQGTLITEYSTKNDTSSINLKKIRERCKSKLESDECYKRFAEIGLNYGSSFQGIHELYVGATEVLGRIELPKTVTNKSEKVLLHPSLMDAALQTTMGLRTGESKQTFLPFALKELIIITKLPAKVFAYTRYSKGVDPKSSVVKFDIDITDEEGNVCASLKEFTARLFSSDESGKESDILYATSEWQEEQVKRQKSKGKSTIIKSKVFLLGVNKDNEEKLKKEFRELNVEQLIAKTEASTIIQNFQTVFKYIKEELKKKPKELSHVLVIVRCEENRHLAAMFSGLFKTAMIENPRIHGKVLEVEDDKVELNHLIAKELEPETFEDVEVRYSNETRREVKRLKEVKFDGGTGNGNVIKDGGVYWITGGMGGLGKIFAEYLGKTKDVKVILSGRTEPGKTKQEQLVMLKEAGIDAEYIQGDVSKREDVEQIVSTIKEKHNQLDGIIHSAGVIKDAFIIKKTEDELEAVFKPKVSGILNIDEATKREKLDFVVLFSSITGAMGNVGQSDYSGANTFLDEYAVYRNRLVKAGKRTGKTVSINWPLWKEGGMRVDEISKTMIEKHTGIKPLSTKTGTHAFNRIIEQDQYKAVLVVTGNSSKIREVLRLGVDVKSAVKINEFGDKKVMSIDRNQVEKELSTMFCELLKISEDQMDMETDFSDYGVDSILMTNALNLLEERYGCALEPTLIVQYPTIKELANYLIKNDIAMEDQKPDDQPVVRAETKELQEIAGGLESKKHNRFRSNVYTSVRSGKVAIISQACRLPQSNSIEQFWENLKTGKDLITTVPKDRWNSDQFYSPDKSNPNTSYTNHGGFVDGIGYFDAEFFGISDHEAITMDPQQRIILELTQELIDRAGYGKEEIGQTKTGVYLGAKDNNYVRNNYHLMPEASLQHTVVNTISNMIAARVSDFYNFTGESKVIDTACSSSLVALNDACKSIIAGESVMAIAGGIFFMIDPFSHIAFSKAQVLSEDGKSYVFDERAKGFVLGEGAGLVMLKDYDTAIRDHDNILAVILGSSVNNDGKTMGVTVPNQSGQQAVIQSAIEVSGITPDTIGYLETHGTGTLLGDPIEIKAASEVYRKYTNKKGFCAVGSVKSNLGHTMTTAGICSLIKVILSLQNQQIPATLNCEKPHQRFKFEETPFFPNTSLKSWEPVGEKRRAAISSFGFGGTNCHMILEEWLSEEQSSCRPRKSLHPTVFNRKWYWFGDSITPEFDDMEKVEQPAKDNNEDISETITVSNQLEDYLAGKLKVILNVDSLNDVDRYENYMEMGIDSVQLVKLSAEVETEIGIELYPTIFFEYQNLHELSESLSEKYRAEIKKYFNVNIEIKLPKKTIPLNKRKKIIDHKTKRNSIPWTNGSINILNKKGSPEPVAIIGISGRFPGSPDLTTFWKNIEEEKDLITEIPKDRWDWKEYWGDADKEINKTKAKWGGFIDDIDKFDPMFFGISPKEAGLMDPQHRLLMQTVWHTLEDAGYTKKDVDGKVIGVFVGISTQDYFSKLQGQPLDAQSSVGIAHCMAANRISYWLNLQGPSEPVDTACSSSLAAIHKAIQSIHNDGCEMAIAGGVNIILSPEGNIAFDKASAITHYPTVKTFDKDANGYVRGEGVGAVLLKPLSKAIESGDHIYAVIKGSSVNHSGRSQSLTAPNPNGQKKVIIHSFEKAGLIGKGLDYIEAHGATTELGDPIEINAIKHALSGTNCEQHTCKIGAIKPNIGHLEAASGMAALFKVIFAMQNQIKPGVKGFKELNPYIEIEDTPLYIKAGHEQWENNKNSDGEMLPRRAGINSFGFGGVNAHLIIEEYPEDETIEPESNDDHLFILSAQNQEQLIVYVQTWIDYLNDEELFNARQTTYTLQTGREALPVRLAIVMSDKFQLIQRLQNYLNNLTASFTENNIFDNVNSDSDMFKIITEGASGDFILKTSIESKNLRKLALLWIEGFDIPWEELYKDEHIRKTSLPTYPFAKERCWVETKNENESTPELRKSIDNKGELFEFDHARSLKNNITNYLVQTLSKELDITSDKVKLNKNLQDYGLDSIVGMKIMRGINETFQIKMTGREMLEHTTIESISEHISKKARLNREEKDNEVIEPKASDEKDASIRIELSEGQKGLWALQKLSPDMSTYNVPIVFKIEQKLDISSIKKACEFLLKEYPILNTIIQEDNGVPYQTISNNDLFFQEEKIHHLKEKEIIPFVQKRVKEPFNLEKGPLIRVNLFSVTEDEIIVLITFHHLIIDGTSAIIFTKTLWSAYHDYINNNIPKGVIHNTKYSDFVEWEKNMLNKPEGKVHLDYWREQLAGELPVLSLPANHSSPVEQSYKGITYTESVDSQLSENIEQFAKKHKVNLSVVFLGIFKLLLFRYSDQHDIIVGMTTLGRPERRFEDVMGCFVNMIPLRSRLSNDQLFIEFLKELQLTLVDGLDHSVYPFSCLVKNLKLSNDRKAPPVFQAAFIYKNFAQNLSIKDLINPELFNIGSGKAQISFMDSIYQECADVFRLEIYKEGNCFKLNFKYNPDLFDASIIEQMMAHYIKLVQEIIKRPDLEIGCFDILLEKEKQQQPLMPNNIINRKKPTEQDYDLNSEITDHAEANKTEKKLLEIWQMVCGDQNISLEEDFFEYDLDSIRAAQFLSIINKNFSENKITQSDLFQKPTIKDLALILDNKQARLNSETSEKEYDKETLTTMRELSKNASTNNENKKEKTKSISPDLEQGPDSILIPLTESEGKISFYCLASGHGDLLRFSNLAEKLKEDCSFYMLQPPDNELLDDKKFNLNYLAEIYANLIMSRETEKCIIGGFCIGGVLTLEISEILKKEGLNVRNPILIDSPFPMFSKCRYNFRKLMKYVFNLPGIENSWVGKLSINGRSLDLFFSDSGLLAQTKMLHLYKLKDFHGSANIIISKTLSYFEQLLFDRWNSYVKGSLKKHYIPGFHGNIFNDQNINCLAETIKKCLK